MKAQLQFIATTALVLLNAIPGALSAKHHHHLDDFEEEEESPSVHSVFLRGAAAAVAASTEDVPDEDEELIQYQKGRHYSTNWKKYTTNVNPYNGKNWGRGYAPHTPYIPTIPKVFGGMMACESVVGCKWNGGNCVKQRGSRGYVTPVSTPQGNSCSQHRDPVSCATSIGCFYNGYRCGPSEDEEAFDSQDFDLELEASPDYEGEFSSEYEYDEDGED
eukprot:scaffold10835_cov153-Skeletonema_menzelii.AAC.6